MAAAKDAKSLIRDRALALGFDAVGFCRAELGPEAITLAEAEGLEGHARSIAVRLNRRD